MMVWNSGSHGHPGVGPGKTVCILHIHMSYSLNSLKGDI